MGSLKGSNHTEIFSSKLTAKNLKDLSTKKHEDNRFQRLFSKLHHEILGFRRDRELEDASGNADTILKDLEYYEDKFAQILTLLDNFHSCPIVSPCIGDVWCGYQQGVKRLYGTLQLEIDLVGDQVETFTNDLGALQQLSFTHESSKHEEKTDNTPEMKEPLNTVGEIDATSEGGDNSLLFEMEVENSQLREEINSLKARIRTTERDMEKLRQENNLMSDTIKNMKHNQSYLTPRPVPSLDDLVDILGDENVAARACEMAETLHSQGIDIHEYIQNGLNWSEEGLKLPQEDQNFNVARKGILKVSCGSDVLAHALARRVGSTSGRFEALEKRHLYLQKENTTLKEQIVTFQEIESKRSLARQRHKEEVHSERKTCIQNYLEMLAERGEDAWKDQLIGMGAGGDVPKLFRFIGKIRNKHMSKRDTEKLVREVWKDRSASLAGKNISLVDFLGNHLQKKMGISAAVLELGYNFLFSLWKYQWDADCELFLKILVGETREEVYIAQNNLQIDLEELFEALDKAKGPASGYIRKEELVIALRAFFRVGKLDGKSEKRFEEVLHALDLDQPGALVEWRKVFEEDREFNQGEFAECVRDQFLIERGEIYDGIGVALYEECGEDDCCTCEQLVAALASARPTLGEKSILFASALFQEREQEAVKITTALKFLSEMSLESDEENLHHSILRKQKTEKTSLGGKSIKQTVAQRKHNPLIASALEEVRQFWMATTH